MAVLAAPPFALAGSRSGRPRDGRRLALALGISLTAHAWLLAGPPAISPSAPLLPAALSVRFETAAPEEPPATPSAPGRPQDDEARPTREPSRLSSRSVAPRRESSAPTAVVPPSISDPTYYAARDLDVYPRLARPLNLAALERPGASREDARIVLELLIDEHGIVRDATVIEATPRGALEDVARAELASARFLPAMKNDRPVKSRVVLRIEPGAAARD